MDSRFRMLVMLLRQLCCFALGFTLMGCGGTYYKMHGVVDGDQEVFNGTFVRRFSGVGDFQIRSTKGRVCTGEMPFEGKTRARGTITCNDGQTGTIELTTDGEQGNGAGTIGGRPFVFTAVL